MGKRHSVAKQSQSPAGTAPPAAVARRPPLASSEPVPSSVQAPLPLHGNEGLESLKVPLQHEHPELENNVPFPKEEDSSGASATLVPGGLPSFLPENGTLLTGVSNMSPTNKCEPSDRDDNKSIPPKCELSDRDNSESTPPSLEPWLVPAVYQQEGSPAAHVSPSLPRLLQDSPVEESHTSPTNKCELSDRGDDESIPPSHEQVPVPAVYEQDGSYAVYVCPSLPGLPQDSPVVSVDNTRCYTLGQHEPGSTMIWSKPFPLMAEPPYAPGMPSCTAVDLHQELPSDCRGEAETQACSGEPGTFSTCGQSKGPPSQEGSSIVLVPGITTEQNSPRPLLYTGPSRADQFSYERCSRLCLNSEYSRKGTYLSSFLTILPDRDEHCLRLSQVFTSLAAR